MTFANLQTQYLIHLMKIPIFILIILLYLSANYYVFNRIWSMMPPNTILRVSLIALAVLTSLGWIIAALIGDSMPIPVTSLLSSIGSSWMFIVIYFVLVFAFQDLILLLNKPINFIPANLVTQSSKDNWLFMLFTIGFVTMLMVGGYLRYTWKERVYLPIQLAKPLGDSITQKSLKIVAVSDLHLGYTIGKGELKKWVRLINEEKPDIILLAGDLVDNSLRPVKEQKMADVLRTLNAPMGVYACLGNHEYIGSADQRENIKFYKEANIHLLKDEVAEIDSLFYVIGRDDRSNSHRKELSELVANLDTTKPLILLDHQPYNLKQASENGIDLQISGHTHKGQVWPISLITKMLYEIDHGYLQKGNSHIYVSSGLGIWGGKFRIGTQSEFVVIDINKKGE